MVDFSSQRDGLVWARRERVLGTAVKGQFVLALDFDDELVADAMVQQIDDRFVYLNVYWRTQRNMEHAVAASLNSAPVSGRVEDTPSTMGSLNASPEVSLTAA